MQVAWLPGRRAGKSAADSEAQPQGDVHQGINVQLSNAFRVTSFTGTYRGRAVMWMWKPAGVRETTDCRFVVIRSRRFGKTVAVVCGIGK